MTMLNGVNHMQMFVTDEEKVVIDAMRAGAKVQATFHNATFEQAENNTNELPKKVLGERHITDLTHGKIPFISVCAKNESGSIELNHFVEVGRKSH